jgi:uncharacterized membrane protein YhaH (DUF805 family)
MNNPFFPAGRMTRLPFFGIMVGINLLSAAIDAIGGDEPSAIHLLFFVLMWPAITSSIQRAHDLGRSAGFGVIPITAALVASIILNASVSPVAIVIGLVGLLGAIVVGAWLTFVPGTDGPNEYGEGPSDLNVAVHSS